MTSTPDEAAEFEEQVRRRVAQDLRIDDSWVHVANGVVKVQDPAGGPPLAFYGIRLSGETYRMVVREAPVVPPPRSTAGRGSGVDPEFDLTDELVDMGSLDQVTREVIPPEERTRRGILWLLGTGFVVLLALQVGFALAVSADTWARVGPVLTTFTTVIAAGIGAATTYYFTHRD